MLHFCFKKNFCLPIGVLAFFLIPFRSVAQEVSPPISPPLLTAKIDSPMVGAIPSLDLATIAPVSAISATNPWLSNNRLLARADLLYWRSLSLFRNQNFRLLNSQDSGTNFLAESVSPVAVDLSVLSPISSDSLVAQAIAETEEVISDSVPVTEVSQTNEVNPEDVMPVVPTNTNTELEPETSNPQDVDELIRAIRNSVADKEGAISPALTVLTPIGFGGYLGSVSIGGAYQSPLVST